MDALKILAVTNLYFYCWIEDWEKPLLNNNDPVARAQLCEKYWGLVFRDIDNVEKCCIPYPAETWNTRKAEKVVGLFWQSLPVMTERIWISGAISDQKR